MSKVCEIATNDSNYPVKPRNGPICPFYRVWFNMINRVYSSTRHSYKNITVCNEWLTFSKFKEWMETQDWQGKELDKDLLVKGSLTYSDNTCIFINREVNMFISGNRRKNKNLMTGVILSKSGRFIAQCNQLDSGSKTLGRFDTELEAHKRWLTEKQKLAKILAERQENPLVKAALLKYYQEF